MKSIYRIACPLCGAVKHKSNLSKNNPINRILIQSFIGRRKIKYSECLDVGVLNTFQKFIISRLENIYERLTGVNIQQLIINSNQSLTTKIVPSAVPITINPSVDTAFHSPVDIAVCKNVIVPKMVVIE